MSSQSQSYQSECFSFYLQAKGVLHTYDVTLPRWRTRQRITKPRERVRGATFIKVQLSTYVDRTDMSVSNKVLVPLQESQLNISGQPYSVSVLKVGYCHSQSDGTFRADGTITLITGPKTILVDTGGPWDRDFLLKALRQKGLEQQDIDVVVGTHGHSDHIGNLSLFPTALIIVGYDVSKGDTYQPNEMARGHAYTLDDHVR